jgi:hypothetical protein
MSKDNILTTKKASQFGEDDIVVLASDVKELLKLIAERNNLYYGDGVAENEMEGMCINAIRELTKDGTENTEKIRGKRYVSLIRRDE